MLFSIPIEYFLSLSAAFLYAVSVLFMKRAIDLGAGSIRVTFVLNWFMFLAFLPLLWVDNQVKNWTYLPSTLAVSLCFILAQLCISLALKSGAASVQTPVMGTKAFMVAIFATFISSKGIPASWWLASGLAIIAVYFLSYSEGCPILRKSNLLTILLSFLAASFFGLADVLMELYAPIFGEIPFLVTCVFGSAIGSFCLIPFLEGSLFKMPKQCFSWVFWASFIYAIEAIMFYLAISFYGKATAVNILYSSRGMWSILLVWTIGHYFNNTEKQVGRSIMLRRASGAMIIFISIILVICNH